MKSRSFLVRSVLAIFAAIAVVVIAGFFVFAVRLAGVTAPASPRADGIVALTGGSARIDAALGLLNERRGERLLITGVNPAVGVSALLGAQNIEPSQWSECCVELGREARDTIGNAEEARSWTTENGFGSLIVVTSDYHMPRALMEFAAAMPEIDLTAYPVRSPNLDPANWWRDGDAFQTILREYIKLISARIRLSLSPAMP